MSQVFRFNTTIKTLGMGSDDRVVAEFYHYDLCNGTDHFHCSIFTFSHGTNSAKKIGPCDGESCKFGRKQVYPMLLPWEAQEAIGFKQPVPKGFVLVHQRFNHENRPYFKVFGEGAMICPSMARTAHLLPEGHQTLVLIRERKSDQVRAVLVRNEKGKPFCHQIAQTTHTGWPGENIDMILRDQVAEKA